MSLALTQQEADALLAIEKYYNGHERFSFPSLGGSLRVPLFSADRHEEFSFDITRGKLVLQKNTYQNRARKVIVLARLDIGGPPHRNPDGTEIPCPHLHVFREGFGDKWAIPLPDRFSRLTDHLKIMEEFMSFCNVITKPVIERELFT